MFPFYFRLAFVGTLVLVDATADSPAPSLLPSPSPSPSPPFPSPLPSPSPSPPPGRWVLRAKSTNGERLCSNPAQVHAPASAGRTLWQCKAFCTNYSYLQHSANVSCACYTSCDFAQAASIFQVIPTSVYKNMKGCTDLVGWRDSAGDTCATYESNRWCHSSWVPNYQVHGISATEACCACASRATGACALVHRCHNGGECADGVNGYTCNCPLGYSGTHCDVSIMDWEKCLWTYHIGAASDMCMPSVKPAPCPETSWAALVGLPKEDQVSACPGNTGALCSPYLVFTIATVLINCGFVL